MARKPAKMYRRLKGPAYTRRKYIGGVPNNRIHQFHVGNRRAAETGEFTMELNLIADESCQIRHTALEAARVISNSTIRKVAGAQNYALRGLLEAEMERRARPRQKLYQDDLTRSSRQLVRPNHDRIRQLFRSREPE